VSRLRRLSALVAASSLVLVTAACGEDSSEEPTTGSLAGIEVSGDFNTVPEVTVPDGFTLEETSSEVLDEGDGSPLVEGQPAILGMTLVNVRTGEVAFSTAEGETPLNLPSLDQQNLFAAVVEDAVGVASGSRLLFGLLPADLYGPTGNEQLGIEPDDQVLLVVDVLSGPPSETLEGPEGEAVEPPDGTPGVVEDADGVVTGIDFTGAPADPPTELTVIPLIEGDGPEARDDSVVAFNYLGQVWGSDEVFDESYSRGEPTPFGLGVSGLIQAWDEGLVGTKRGSRVMIIAPPETAYGDSERPGIPANSTLVFVIDVLGVG